MSQSTSLPNIRINGKEFVADGLGRALTIGRDPASDVRLDHPRVSRRHATLQAEPRGWVFRDVGSTNGSFRDGQQVTEVLVAGDVHLMLGNPADGAPLDLALTAIAAAPPAAPAAVGPPTVATPPATTAAPAPVAAPSTPASPPPPVDTAKLGERVEVHQAQEGGLRIGREPGNDIVVKDLMVSRRHAEIARRPDGGYDIADLGSSNGTFVNGHRIQRGPLTDGDLVSIHNHLFRFEAGRLEEYLETGVAFEGMDITVKVESGKVILEGVSFSLEPSSLLAVVGPSGSGKSTLMNALNGWRPATTGTVLYGGRDLYSSFEDLRQRIGFVPQDDILHPQLTVRKALKYAAELRFPADVTEQQREARIQEVLQELGLEHRADLRIDKLSGGQRKRVSVALELLTKPSVIFLDEPTSGLDPGHERELMGTLRHLADGGRTVIVVTHSTQSLHLCDRVLILATGGRMAYFGPPVEALEYFGRQGVQRFYSDIFTALEERTDIDWGARFRHDPAYQRHVAQPLSAEAARRPVAAAQPLPPRRVQPWFSQFSTLTRRYFALIVSDRRYLVLLLLQAPVLGVVLWAMFGPRRLSNAHAPEAIILLLAITLGVTWFGILNAVREIVKEAQVYRRERSVGLSISAYLASKVAVLGAFTVVSSILLVVIALAKQEPFIYDINDPGKQKILIDGNVMAPKTEIAVAVILAGLAAMALGLLISAVANNADKAVTLVPVVIVPQLVLSGGVAKVEAPVLAQVQYLASTQWGMAATASTVDLNRLNEVNLQVAGVVAVFGFDPRASERTDEENFRLAEERAREERVDRWEHRDSVWFVNVFTLAVLSLGALGGTYYMLRRKDPNLLLAGQARAGPRVAAAAAPQPSVAPHPPVAARR